MKFLPLLLLLTVGGCKQKHDMFSCLNGINTCTYREKIFCEETREPHVEFMGEAKQAWKDKEILAYKCWVWRTYSSGERELREQSVSIVPRWALK